MFEAMVRGPYDAMARKDLDAMMASWAEDGVWEFPGATRLSGTYRGKSEIRGFFRRLFDGLDSIHFTIRHAAMTNPVGLTVSNVVYVEWTEEARRVGRTVVLDGITVVTFHGGKVTHGRDYFFDLAALEAFWSDATEPPVERERELVPA